MSIEEQQIECWQLRDQDARQARDSETEMCWEQHNKAAAMSDGQENILQVVSGDIAIMPSGEKRPRTKRSYRKGQRRRRLEAQLPRPAA